MKPTERKDYILFDRNTLAIVYGMQEDAIQRMLDFDYICRREKPSVAAIVNPTRDGWHRCFFGSSEIAHPHVPDAEAGCGESSGSGRHGELRFLPVRLSDHEGSP